MNGKLWALCGGKWKSDYSGFETNGSLVRINPATNAIEQTISLATPYMSTNNLIINSTGNTLYYCIDGKVYEQSISSSIAEQTPKLNKNLYAIFIDKTSNYFYAADAKGFKVNGWIYRYDLNFAPVDSFEVGIAPSFFYSN